MYRHAHSRKDDHHFMDGCLKERITFCLVRFVIKLNLKKFVFKQIAIGQGPSDVFNLNKAQSISVLDFIKVIRKSIKQPSV